MSEGKSSGIAIGCLMAVAILVIAVVIALVVFVPRVIDKTKGAFKTQGQIVEAMDRWAETLQATGGDAGVVAPADFAGFSRDGQEEVADPRGLELGKTGHLTEYSDGSAELTVWATEGTDLETEAMTQRLEEQNEDRFTNKSSWSNTIGSTSILSYSGSPPSEAGLLVRTGERILLFQSNDKELDLKDLFKEYVREAAAVAAVEEVEVESEVAPEAAEPAPAP